MMYYIPYILVMALITYAIRMIPFTFFQKELNHPFIKSFLFYVPYAVLGAMTFPAIFTSTGQEFTQIVSASIACVLAIVLAYRGKSLIVVACYACVCVYVLQWVFNLIS